MSIPKTVHIDQLNEYDFQKEFKDCFEFALTLCRPTMKSAVLGHVNVYLLKDSFKVGRIETTAGRGKGKKTLLLKDSSFAHLEEQIKDFIESQRMHLLFLVENGAKVNPKLTAHVRIFWDVEDVEEIEEVADVQEVEEPTFTITLDKDEDREIIEFLKNRPDEAEEIQYYAKITIEDFINNTLEREEEKARQEKCQSHSFVEISRSSDDGDGERYFDDDGEFMTVEFVYYECEKCQLGDSRFEYSNPRY